MTFDYLGAVREFHTAYGLTDSPTPTVLPLGDRLLRVSLLQEEYDEYTTEEAMPVVDLSLLAKELADVLYVAFGTAVAYGLPMDEIFAEVQRSNMSKLGEDGKPVKRDDGKVLKGPKYSPADIESVLANAHFKDVQP